MRYGKIEYDSRFGHVCTCTETEGPDPLDAPTYDPTVGVDRSQEPTEGGSYFYVCSRCGAGAWSGC